MGGQRTNPALVEAGQRKDVSGAVAEFGEEPHQGLGGVIGADDQTPLGAGDSELGDHTLTGFDVAEDEILAVGLGYEDAPP